MTRKQLNAMISELHKSSDIHRENAEKHVRNDPIWTARMAAMHLCLDLTVALNAALNVTSEEDPYDGK